MIACGGCKRAFASKRSSIRHLITDGRSARCRTLNEMEAAGLEQNSYGEWYANDAARPGEKVSYEGATRRTLATGTLGGELAEVFECGAMFFLRVDLPLNPAVRVLRNAAQARQMIEQITQPSAA
jgi:hypothetical protein